MDTKELTMMTLENFSKHSLCPKPILYSRKKVSNKQKAQRERFAIKGFASSVLGRVGQIIKMEHLTDVERTRFSFMADAAMLILKYFDGHTKSIIKETKNV